MKKIAFKYKILLIILVIGTFFSLLFFSFYYNWNISYILRDIIYFPINLGTSNINNLNFDKNNNEQQEELEDLKALLDIKNTLSEFDVISGIIVSRNTLYWSNEVIINKGSNDGIEEGMAVVDQGGLVGKIDKVSLSTSSIKLITSNDTTNKISVKIWINNTAINKVLTTDQNNLLIISGIDNYADIKVGDLVTTSGLSEIFPSGINIGHVEKIENDKFGISKKAYIHPSSNLDNLRFVFVLKRKV